MEDNLSKIVSEFIGSSEELKKDVVEAARAGIKKEITEYFTGYSSPFRKQVHEYLQKNIPMASFPLPSYAEIVNKEIIAEIDKMAAQTCISTFCKSFRKVLSGIPTEEEGRAIKEVMSSYHPVTSHDNILYKLGLRAIVSRIRPIQLVTHEGKYYFVFTDDLVIKDNDNNDDLELMTEEDAKRLVGFKDKIVDYSKKK